MYRKMFQNLLNLVGFALITACGSAQSSPTISANLPNPASVYCEQSGGELEIRQDSSGGEIGICIFPDGIECEEWAYYRGECLPTSPDNPTFTPIETAIYPPVTPADYQDWWTYTSPTYGFSFLMPPDWVVDETTTSDSPLNGHMLNLHPQVSTENLNIRITFRLIGEDVMLWPTGVGAGDMIPQGTLEVAGQPAIRVLFVCPTGQVNSVWYHQNENEANIQRNDMEFGIIFSYADIYCEEDYSLEGKVLRVGEMIISSIKMP